MAYVRKAIRDWIGLGPDDPEDPRERVLLAWVWLETRFYPDVTPRGFHWADTHPAKYRQLVLENPILAECPAREDKDAWTAYGYFQLLAPYYLPKAIQLGLLPPTAHPRELARPEINVAMGIPDTADALDKNGPAGEVWPEAFLRARLYRAGCGWDGGRCSFSKVQEIRRLGLAALQRWGVG